MINLETRYMGLVLKNPLIVGSSGLTDNIDKIRKAEDSKAGAVILKSIFEEQINYQAGVLTDESQAYPEAADYIAEYTKSHSLDNYLKLITSAKESVDIPVIPSINCASSEDWVSFAKNIEAAGADALEINVFFMPVDKKQSAADAEQLYFDLLEKLKSELNIPVAVKLGQRFSNILHLIDQLYHRGADAVVLFNRFYEPDIDVNTMNIVPASVFSSPEDLRYVLRWIAMASAQNTKIGLSASTGVHSGQDAIKYLLAGADTVQVCSALYRNGLEHVATMLETIGEWMSAKGFNNLNDFRGSLNYRNFKDSEKYERAQFMKYFSAYE